MAYFLQALILRLCTKNGKYGNGLRDYDHLRPCRGDVGGQEGVEGKGQYGRQDVPFCPSLYVTMF